MNLPNKITTFRMVCVVIVDFLLLFPWAQVGVNAPVLFGNEDLITFIAFILFVLASFSDFLDGYLARKMNLVTTYGKFMDPIADKLLVDSAFIICAIKMPDLVPATVAVIMICRDLLIDALRQIASTKGKVLAANIWGKAKTFAQMVTLALVLLKDWPFSLIGLPYPITAILCWISAAISILSCVFYFTKNLDVFKD